MTRPSLPTLLSNADSSSLRTAEIPGLTRGTMFATTEIRMRHSILTVLALGLLAAGCNDHAPVQAHRSAVLIGDRGISIPLPPPSVLQAPQQTVEVHGDLDGSIGEGAEVRIIDNDGGDEASVPAEAGHFTAELDLDLTSACLEAWVVNAEGAEGERRFYSTRIESDDTILVVAGCER